MKLAASVLVLLLPSLGCNAILGIDAARLDTSEAGSNDAGSSDAGSSSPDTGGACSLTKDTTACNSCVAANCCTEFEACKGDPTCKQGLIDYAFCLGNNFTSDAGASCDEEFSGKAGSLSLDLAKCAFVDKCLSVCRDQTIGDDLCATYCGCMATVCKDHPFEAGSCSEVCANFDANQLVCRPYHCSLAKITMMDESKRTLHCGHASGNTPCH